MNKSNLSKLVLFVFLVPVIFSVPGVAHNAKELTIKSHIDEKSYGSHLDSLFDSVNASLDQRQKITSIVMSHKPKIEPLKEEYKRKSQEFLSCIMSGESSEVVMYEQDALNRLHGQISCEYGLMQLEIRRVLSPQQWKMFQEYGHKQGWRPASK